MFKSTLFLVSFLLVCFYSFAQDGEIKVNSEWNPDQSLSIYTNSQKTGQNTVKLKFTTLRGFEARRVSNKIFIATVGPGKKEILRLKKIPDYTGQSARYNYSVFDGASLRKSPDENFKYVLPTSENTDIKVFSVRDISDLEIVKDKGSSFFAIGFTFRGKDSICAVRAGQVLEVVNILKVEESRETIYQSGRNKITIQHKDGTIAKYTITAPVDMMIKEGEFVIPGQPLAAFKDAELKNNLQLQVYYLSNSILRSPDIGKKSPYVGVPLKFTANNGEFFGVLKKNEEYKQYLNPDIISEELSKRQKKKLKL
ncbi:hypothetical protein [Jiulongibacter sp. NS-SX5]|uniref:hypothetical protein n=1 Tax=Jiulongibacter sp. NS-SX5 TaxID=3463854 RepID=UPI00405A3551